MTATVFKKAAQKNPADVFDYEREVKQVWQDFPEAKDKMYFFDVCSGAVVYSGQSEGRGVWPKIKARKLFKEARRCFDFLVIGLDLLNEIEKFKASKGSGHFMMRAHNFIFLYTGDHAPSLLSEKASPSQKTFFTFDHELGHALVPKGSGQFNANLSECVADAYAVIRHLQRYGAESPAIDTCVINRTLCFILVPDRDHFTSPVVEQILARRYEIDWNSLTPAETTQMAEDFALKYAIPLDRLKAMDQGFANFRESPVKMMERILSTDSLDILKWGTLAFTGLLDRAGVTEDWQSELKKIAEKQKKFSIISELKPGPKIMAK